MTDLTLAQALQLPEVRSYIGGIVREQVAPRRLDPAEERDMRIQESVAAGEPVAFLGDDSPLAQRLKHKGLDRAHFGATPPPEAA